MNTEEQNMWGWSIFSPDFFHSFNLQRFGKKESVCDFMSKNFHYENNKFFSADEKLRCFGKDFLCENLKDPCENK